MRRILFISALSLSFFAKAQDIHYTQSNQTPMLVNPAATGIFNGWERFSVNHKNQWVNSGTKWFTTSLGAELNFFKPKRGNAAHIGLGVQLYNDIGGDSKFGTKMGIFTLNGIVPIGEMQTISAAIQMGLGQRSGDLSGLTFGNQFNGTQFDNALPNGETNNLVSFMYADFSTGIMYRFGNHSIGFVRDNITDIRVGAAYYHFNTPKLEYRLGYNEELYSKWVFHASILKDFDGTNAGIESFYNHYRQGPHVENLLGLLVRYRLSSGAKTSGLSQDMYVSGGIAYRHKDAISPIVNMHVGSFTFGMSYDVTIADLGRVARGGGLEFSLTYANLDHALFKTRRR